ncbi:MAG: hypothetical protein KatS3mg101_0981 [Patescibacteria group bacterium]|nr:MAG: hypothetical protein KatS3mg101_0981 [Patescibacteria group bacterium]
MAELYYPPTQNGLQKTLVSQLNAGATQMTLSNTTGVQNKPGVVVVDRIDTTGTQKDVSVREYISYTGVSGNNLTGLTRGLAGSSDQDHLVGAVVEFIPDVTVFQAINDVITTEHNTDGTHDSTKVAMLAGTQTFTGDKTFTGALKTDSISEATSGAKTTLNNGLKTDTIDEKTSNTGVTIDGLLVKDKAIQQMYDNGNITGSVTINWANGLRQKATLTGNVTLDFSNPVEGQSLRIVLNSGRDWREGLYLIYTNHNLARRHNTDFYNYSQ